MKYSDYEPMNVEQKRAAFPAWHALMDRRAELRDEIAAGAPKRRKARRDYYSGQQSRYAEIDAMIQALRADQSPPQRPRPRGISEREIQKLEELMDEMDSCAIAEIEGMDATEAR